MHNWLVGSTEKCRMWFDFLLASVYSGSFYLLERTLFRTLGLG